MVSLQVDSPDTTLPHLWASVKPGGSPITLKLY
jgi:hypothetical protein